MARGKALRNVLLHAIIKLTSKLIAKTNNITRGNSVGIFCEDFNFYLTELVKCFCANHNYIVGMLQAGHSNKSLIRELARLSTFGVFGGGVASL
ncbi:MAG: hypothetical protein QM529_04560 [Hydrotalea sp.]|nr:hypothetical protein [Hydrotalea sp.]